MAKRNIVQINSPKGELRWIFITGDGKEDLNGNPRYSASVYFDAKNADLKTFQAKVEAFWEENKPKGAKKAKSLGIYRELKEKATDKTTVMSITQPYDKDEYVETGMVCISGWTGTKNKDQSAKKVKTYNAKGSEVSLGGKLIGNGSIGKLGLAMGVYENGPNAGVTLYLNGVQLTKFVEFSSGANFEEEDDEDGFSGIEEDFDSVTQPEQEEAAKPTSKVRL